LAALLINIGFAPAARAADSQNSIAQEFEKIKPQFVFEARSVLPRIIFEAETDNSIDLYFCSPDRKTEALTDRRAARYPSPSADGRFVFYQDSEKDRFIDADVLDPAFDPMKRDPKFLFQIFKLDMKTKLAERISDGSALDSYPVVSPAGNRLALASRIMEDKSKWHIIIMDFNGKQRESVNSADANSQLYPSWSPDGKKIAYVSTEWLIDKDKHQPVPSTRLMVRDLEKKTTASIPTSGKILNSLSWSPAGDQIAFDVIDMKTEKSSIWKINVDGTNMQQVTEGAYDRQPSWFPDGTRLIFSRARDENGLRYICAVDLATQKVTKLLSAKNATLQYPKVYNAASQN
jgi:dipeptidyl aminopeptidase/acylaminoacyl peptidase